MLRPLVIACSETKNPGRLPAYEKYEGPFWQTYRTHGTGYMGPVYVLSALHGLIPADTVIDDYDAFLIPSRSKAYGNRIRASTLSIRLRTQARELGIREVDFVGGVAYLEALTLAEIPVHHLSAGGIGVQRSALGAHLRAHRSLPKLQDLLRKLGSRNDGDDLPEDVDALRKLLIDRYGLDPETWIYLSSGGNVVVSKIAVPKALRGERRADLAMRHLTRWADRYDRIVTLTASSDFGASKARLERWYRGLGFVPNKGRKRDYRFNDGMIRRPVPVRG